MAVSVGHLGVGRLGHARANRPLDTVLLVIGAQLIYQVKYLADELIIGVSIRQQSGRLDPLIELVLSAGFVHLEAPEDTLWLYSDAPLLPCVES